ncbi:hypothetical protein Acor_14230 [Acrocarpospora corrugata]|uniref:Uncharacterized protein n=1 Tax=Acrocarpospora corrugata TaxID=35763 RepID=A0A5M3VTY5_9ACTN|nr:hypothetical protein Acor_14230 [Acrocarpospora corrugata]
MGPEFSFLGRREPEVDVADGGRVLPGHEQHAMADGLGVQPVEKIVFLPQGSHELGEISAIRPSDSNMSHKPHIPG